MKVLVQSRKTIGLFLVCSAALLFLGSNLVGTVHAAQTEQSGLPQNEPRSAPEVSAIQQPAGPAIVQPQQAPAGILSESTAAQEEVKAALMKESFSYAPRDMLDPFIPFITPVEAAPPPLTVSEEDTDLPPEPKRPLTPLQKMTLAELERGLKAITWGELGRKAVIEDAAGKGYIVSVGTPAGDRNGVITEIFNDRLVIQQESWDKKQKKMIPQNSIVKLRKDRQK